VTIRIEPLGDCALLIRFGERIDVELNGAALRAAAAISAADLPGVHDVAPAYASVCLRYDPAAWPRPARPHAELVRRICDIVENAADVAHREPEPIEIPVCYGGEFGPDLAAVADRARLTMDAVVAAHTAAPYRVAMLGFAPGFPYMLGLDPALAAPRLAEPRIRVPAGSVAIGGSQTGIYPRESPGGWRILGRTPIVLFDAARDPPALLAPGQTVRFRAIAPEEFARLSP